MASIQELAKQYASRIGQATDVIAECRAIANDINRLTYEGTGKSIEHADKIAIAEQIANQFREIAKAHVDFGERTASSNTDFNEFSNIIINFLGGRK